MARTFAGTGLLLVLLSGSPASAIDNPLNGIQLANFKPLDRGPLADFLNLFREQAIPRRVVLWHGGYAPGTVVISTKERRLYYVLPGSTALVSAGKDIIETAFQDSDHETRMAGLDAAAANA